jgi:hypothetical protein
VDIIDTLQRLCTIPSFGVSQSAPITHNTIVNKENINVASPIILIIFSIINYFLSFLELNISIDHIAINIKIINENVKKKKFIAKTNKQTNQ